MATDGIVRYFSWLAFLLTFSWLHICYSQNTYDVRLMDSSYPNKGRVEVYYNFQWNTVCDDNWGYEEARIICQRLGFGANNAVPRSSAYYGQGTGSIQDIQCTGFESSLASCSFTSANSYCAHYEDAGVDCGGNGDEYIRLVNGASPREGRVEIWYDGEWTTLCDNNWSTNEARVACRQLGYETDSAIARSSAYYGRGSGPIRQAQCSGSENSLHSCYLSSGGIWCLSHSSDAGVECRYSDGGGPHPRVVGIMSFVGVSLFLLTIVTVFAVCYTCTRKPKLTPTVTPTGTEMQPMSTTTTTTAATSGANTHATTDL